MRPRDEARPARVERVVTSARIIRVPPAESVEVEVTARPKGTPFLSVDAEGLYEAGAQVLKGPHHD